MPLYAKDYVGRKAPYIKGEPLDTAKYLIVQDPTYYSNKLDPRHALSHPGETMRGKELKTRVYEYLKTYFPDSESVPLGKFTQVLCLDTYQIIQLGIGKVYNKKVNPWSTIRMQVIIEPEQGFSTVAPMTEILYLLANAPRDRVATHLLAHYTKLYNKEPLKWGPAYIYCKALVDGTL